MVQRYRNIPNSFIEFDISPYIHEQDITRFTLLNNDRFPFDISLLADQLAIYPKANIKLPSFTSVYAHFTPRSYEQSSSEEIALFKSGLISGKRILDLSGGLGVDDWAFAKRFEQVDSVDIDDQLNKIVRQNFNKLGVNNINRIDGDAYHIVDSVTSTYDWVYIDADRRVGANRGHALADTEPNILKLKDKIFSFTDHVLLKVSPMLDLHALVAELQTVKQIWVLALKNEVKEILVELSAHQNEQVLVHAVDIDTKMNQFEGNLAAFLNTVYHDTGNYFYEPSLALIKAGLASEYLNNKGIQQIAPNSIYGVSEQVIPDFFGRSFNVIGQGEFSKSKFATYQKGHQISKANIAKRNFKMEVDEIRKQFKIKDGGEEYLFFTENAGKGKLFFHCVKM